MSRDRWLGIRTTAFISATRREYGVVKSQGKTDTTDWVRQDDLVFDEGGGIAIWGTRSSMLALHAVSLVLPTEAETSDCCMRRRGTQFRAEARKVKGKTSLPETCSAQGSLASLGLL